METINKADNVNSKTKYLIFGNGFLGNRMKNYLEDSIISSRKIFSMNDVKEEIEKYNPDIVINCIGKTGTPNVDWCETHKIETVQANITVPLLILDACQLLNKYMVHISTGCIYEGDNNGKGFSENDEPNFFGSFYSRTKFYIEKILKEFNVLQLRIRIPMDIYPSDKNIVNKLIKFDKVLNIKNSITCIPDFLVISRQLMEKRKTGIYNVVNKNPITHPEILDMYKEIVDKNFKYKVLTLDELQKTVSAKRSNCVLSVKKLENEGIEVKEIKDAVKACLIKFKDNLNIERV